MNKQMFYCFLLILLCGAGLMPCTAQQYFNKRHTVGLRAGTFISAIEQNNKYYTIMAGVDSINHVGGGLFKNTTGLKFCVLDSVGNILYTKLYQRDDKLHTIAMPASVPVSNNFTLLPNGTFLYSFAVIDTALAAYNPSYYNMQLGLARFDSMGNVLMYREYDRPYCYPMDATNHLLTDFKPDAYGNWLMLASVVCSGKVAFCLRKLDSNFNEVWVKILSTKASIDNVPKHLLIEPDGYVMTGSMDSSNDGVHTNYYSSLLIKCDTAGTKLWHWQNTYDTTKLQYTINDILRTADGGYVYCGSGEGKPTHYASGEWASIVVKGFVEKLDASRNSVWKRTLSPFNTAIDYVQQTVLKELPNGDIMVAGGAPQLVDTSDKTKGWIRGSLTRLNGVDGSIIWQRYYANPDGNDTMRLSFYDMRQTADGGYILAGEAYNLIDRGIGPIQRGWLVKVDSNGCLGADDPQCKPVGLSPALSKGEGVRVWPNPSSGTFVIALNASLHSPASLPSSASLRGTKQSITATVYDLLGRIIHQQTLSFSNNEASINLNTASGIYILELKDNEGTVWRQRIVVE